MAHHDLKFVKPRFSYIVRLEVNYCQPLRYTRLVTLVTNDINIIS